MGAKRKDRRERVGHQEWDMDLQAGSLGMSIPEMVRRYFQFPGHVLATIRFFKEEERSEVSAKSGIVEEQLQKYESGTETPSIRDLTLLARHYGADLRILLQVFGHVGQDAPAESMGIAADYAGELSQDEKLTMRALFKMFGTGGSSGQ